MPRAWVVETFGEMDFRELPVPQPGKGEIRVRVLAAGICGSDRHIIEGEDPRVPLPLIPGHEGVGEVLEVNGEAYDLTGRPVEPGCVIAFDRAVTCGECFFCTRAESPFLCPNRIVYGISISSGPEPHLRGNYAQEIVLLPGTGLYLLPEDADPATYVSASCSGATAAHSIRESAIGRGERVVVIGPGPLGVWTVALARLKDASEVILTGTRQGRLELGRLFGANLVLNVHQTSLDERKEAVMEATEGLGADCVIDTSGRADAVPEGLEFLRPGGRYVNSGVAVPADPVPVDIYDINRRNLTMKGVWVSDSRDFLEAVRTVEKGLLPFERLVTHRVPLADAPRGLKIMKEEPEALKIVLVP